jgi:hypothetical protein
MDAAWKITSHAGVGPVRFGMTRTQVREAMAVPWDSSRRTPSSRVADVFRSVGTFAYYTESDFLEAIEFSRLQEVVLENLNLTTTPIEQLLRDILLLDPHATVQAKSSGFISKSLGAGVWTEGDRHLPPQSVIVFAPGYYD